MSDKLIAELNARIQNQPFRYSASGTQPQHIRLACAGYNLDDITCVWTVHFTMFGKYYLKNAAGEVSDCSEKIHRRLEPLYSAIIDIDQFMRDNPSEDIKTIKIIALVKRFVCIPPLDDEIWKAICAEIRQAAELGEFTLAVPPQHVLEYGRQIHAAALSAGYGYREEYDGSATIVWL